MQRPLSVMIHQPEYLPWLNLFFKAALADVFILLDNVQFVRRSFHNRNQIKTAQGAQWLTVPVRRAPQQTLIQDILLDNEKEWRQAHLDLLARCYGHTAHYHQLRELLIEHGLGLQDEKLSQLNCRLLTVLCRQMGLGAQLINASDMKARGKASDLILGLCREAGAQRYVCGLGSRAYLREQEFREAGIDILYLPPVEITYRQCYPQLGFIPNISAIDYLANVGFAEATKLAIHALQEFDITESDFRLTRGPR